LDQLRSIVIDLVEGAVALLQGVMADTETHVGTNQL
jgi:hypothetical protein